MKNTIYIVCNFKNILSRCGSKDDRVVRFTDKKKALKYHNKSKRFYQYSEVVEVTY